MKSEMFRDWAEKLARKAIQYPDKTFTQLLEEKIIHSWAEHVIMNN